MVKKIGKTAFTLFLTKFACVIEMSKLKSNKREKKKGKKEKRDILISHECIFLLALRLHLN